MNLETVKKLVNIFKSFNEEIKRIYNTNLKDAFVLSSFLLSLEELPDIKEIKNEDKELIERYHMEFGEITYYKDEMRRAFNTAYLESLSEVENYTIDVSPELIQIFLSVITEEIYKNLEYTNINVLNPYSNTGSLACLMTMDKVIPEENISLVTKNDRETSLAETLKRLTQTKYNIDSALPQLNFRSDIIISDPFFENATDILMFFADYTEYLNQNSFMIINLPIGFVRTRVFSDLLEQYNLTLIMLINGPHDMAEGAMKSSIVVLQRGVEKHEFAQADMVSIKDVEGNIEVLNKVKKYINNYFKGEN